MAEKIIVSPRFTLQVRDFLKGLLVSVLTSVIVVVQSTIEQGSLTFNWKQIGMVAVGSAVAYLAKNFFSAPTVVTTYKTNEQAVNVAENIKDENK
jgi:hypothetical protein